MKEAPCRTLLLRGSAAHNVRLLDDWSDLDVGVVVDDRTYLAGLSELAARLSPIANPWCAKWSWSAFHVSWRVIGRDLRRVDLVFAPESRCLALDEGDSVTVFDRRQPASPADVSQAIAPPPSDGIFAPASAPRPCEELANALLFACAIGVIRVVREDLLAAGLASFEAQGCLLELGRRYVFDNHDQPLAGRRIEQLITDLTTGPPSFKATETLHQLERSAVDFSHWSLDLYGYALEIQPLESLVRSARAASRSAGIRPPTNFRSWPRTGAD